MAVINSQMFSLIKKLIVIECNQTNILSLDFTPFKPKIYNSVKHMPSLIVCAVIDLWNSEHDSFSYPPKKHQLLKLI